MEPTNAEELSPLKDDCSKIILWSENFFRVAFLESASANISIDSGMSVSASGLFLDGFDISNFDFKFVLFEMRGFGFYCLIPYRFCSVILNDAWRSQDGITIYCQRAPLVIKEQLKIDSHHDCFILQDYLMERHPEFFE